MKYHDYIEENTLRVDASRRGGGIEINLEDLLGVEDACMTAYQNYLGGGLLGSIQNSYNFDKSGLSKANQAKVEEITEDLNRYFHNITNGEASDYDEWNDTSYEKLQASRPASAY